MTPDYWKTACRDLAKADPVMKKLIATYPVANFRSRGTPFATLARAIVGQQISTKAAASVWAKFAKRVGRMTPANVLVHDIEALRECGLSRQKASYILDLAAHFADGRINTRRWAREDDEIIIDELVAVKGIGRWTAEMFLMFYLMRPNILPVDDLGLIRGTEKLYFKGRKCLDRKKMHAFGQRWQPWSTVATWYLWRALEAVPQD